MIHSSAIIEEGATIAKNVTIGPFCYVGKDVTLAEGVKLESNIILDGKLFIDEDARIFSHTSIGQKGSDIFIGKRTHIREFTQIGTQNENEESYKIIIADDDFIMGYVQIFPGVEIGQFSIVTNSVRLYENVKCEERVVIGGLSTIESGNTIGTGVMIGGASYVTHDIPPFTLIEGNKANIKGLNTVGLRRRLKDPKLIDEIRLIFKKIVLDGVDKTLAEKISKSHENEYIKKFASFVSESNI